MTKKEIQNNLEAAAYEYANHTIEDPDNHSDAVEVVASDFISGASYVLSNLN